MIGDFSRILVAPPIKNAILRRESPHGARTACGRLRKVGIDTKQEESDIEAESWKVWNTADRCKLIESASVNFEPFGSCG